MRDLNEINYDKTTGKSNCAFEDETAALQRAPRCPALGEAVRIGAELKHDTRKFLVRPRFVYIYVVVAHKVPSERVSSSISPNGNERVPTIQLSSEYLQAGKSLTRLSV